MPDFGGLSLPGPDAPGLYLPSITLPPTTPDVQPVYIHPELTQEALQKRQARLHSSINGFHSSWQDHLQVPITCSTLIFFDCKHFYPLRHHQEAMAIWKARNRSYNFPNMKFNPIDIFTARENSPGNGFQLLNMRGYVGATEPPPHTLLELIAAAISGSPNNALTSREVRLSLMRRYTYFVNQDYGWHAEVTSTLQNNPEHFVSVPRKPDVYDPGNWWRLRSTWPNKVVEAPQLYPPPHPIQPPFQMSYPNELGPESFGPWPPVKKLPSLTLTPISNEACGRTALPHFDHLHLPLEIKKERPKASKLKPLDADEIRTGRTGIARAGLNKIMWEQGQNLIRQCTTSQSDNE